jgi:putative ABC transport system permease protein
VATIAELLYDLRGGVRALRASPTHTTIAVLTIALGIGLNTMMFSIVSSIVMRPLPYRESQALVAINADLPGLSLKNVGFSVPEIDDLAARSDVIDQLTPVWVFDANLTGADRPERVVMVASHVNYFTLLGATPQLGRVFEPSDRADGFSQAVVLSDAAWHRLFGGDPAAIGKQVRIDTDLYSIVGVMPPGFRHPAAAPSPDIDVWSAAGFRANPFPPQPTRSVRMLPSVLARLQPGVTVEEARASLDGFAATIRRDYAADYPAAARWSLRADGLQRVVVGDVQKLLLALSAAVGLVLLIGCANVANLLLARATARHRELAIRLAIGASRGRLIRQLLTENLVLAAVGGAAGVVIALWTERVVIDSLPSALPRVHEIVVDWRAVTFAIGITLLTSVICGLTPALQASRTQPVNALADTSRGSTSGRRQRRVRTAFVVAEIALSLVLVAGAGLLIATVSKLLEVDPGFNSARVTAAKTWIAVPNNPELDVYRTADARAGLIRRLVDQLRAIPGVSGAAVASGVPLSQTAQRVPVRVDGTTLGDEDATAEFLQVTPDYFSVLGVPVTRGRAFREGDDPTAAPAVIIDEDAERRFFPGLDAVGRQIRIGRPGPQGPPPPITVVGVVRTVKHDRLDEPATPHIYGSIYQRSGRSLSLLIKLQIDNPGLQDSLRRAVAAVDPDLPVFAVAPLDDLLAHSIASQRFSATALTAFAVLALLLVVGGVYGVTSYTVTARTREMGVRLAMGARPSDVLRGVVLEALRASTTGVAIGLLLTFAGTRLLRTMLFGVSAIDLRVLAAACAILTAATILASVLPARRAARTDPLLALRAE